MAAFLHYSHLKTGKGLQHLESISTNPAYLVSLQINGEDDCESFILVLGAVSTLDDVSMCLSEGQVYNGSRAAIRIPCQGRISPSLHDTCGIPRH